MKILILSASIDSGHMQAADAIAEELEIRNVELGINESQVEVVDFMSRDTSTLNWLLKKLYLAALGLIPDLYDRIYRLAGVRRFGSITRLIWSTLMYLPFSRLLSKLNPDTIICTHPFPEAAAALWKFLHPKSDKKFTLVAVLTDYSLHEIWIYGGVDLYFVATEEMKTELESHGPYDVFATGIPIRSQFSIRNEELGIRNIYDYNLKTVLIMGGGLGLGAFEDTILALEAIDFKIKIIVVTGSNRKLKSKLEALQSKHELIILGFVDNIAELMQSADLLISKPGALTLSESFAAGLPILLLPPIPGPESLNAEYAVRHGAALSLSNASEITDTIKVLNDVNKLQSMSIAARNISRPIAAEQIASIVKGNGL